MAKPSQTCHCSLGYRYRQYKSCGNAKVDLLDRNSTWDRRIVRLEEMINFVLTENFTKELRTKSTNHVR